MGGVTWLLPAPVSGVAKEDTAKSRPRDGGSELQGKGNPSVYLLKLPMEGKAMVENLISAGGKSGEPARSSRPGDALGRLYRMAVVVLAGFVLLMGLLVIGRAAIYKIHAYERGLHLRGGRFMGVQAPGWHVQIPLVDTVIIVKVNERLGYVERLAAMTSDDVTMDVSLQYTYRVTDPERFALEVDNPERIVFEFVQGKLRDVVNTKPMAEVMHSRAEINARVIESLQEKAAQYGV
ncbi:MAG: SPFH domain-containing protein, partial [Anaerolineae bacterium]|nr:SPFH domain-containing protein [Anaerolineae bacterium]